MKRIWLGTALTVLGLLVSGTAQAGGHGHSGHQSTSTSGGTNSTSSFKNTSTTKSFSTQKTNTVSKQFSTSQKGNYVKSCKYPDGKFCGSGWCFGKDCCPYWSKCCYSSYWGCNVYYCPSYCCWVWYCPADCCYYEVCQ